MPQIAHTAYKKLLAQLMNGNAARPATLYLGLRTDTPAAADTLATATANEVGATTASGYARVAVTLNATNFPDAAIGNDWQIAMLQQAFPQFTGTPAPNNATHYFLCDQAAGSAGNLYQSAPLNPAAFSNTLNGAVSAGATAVALTSGGASLSVGDYVSIGAQTYAGNIAAGQTGNNMERRLVTAIATNTLTLSTALSYNHASGELVTRDGTTRTYVTGFIEQVTPILYFGQG